MQAFISLIPIFTILTMGFFAARTGLFPHQFIKPASRLVFYLGIPFLVFQATVKSPITDGMILIPGLIGAATVLIQALLAIILARVFIKSPPTPKIRRVSWVCSQFHGNMGIMGLAVVYYSLGEQWLGAGALVMGLIMLVHTFTAIMILSFWGDHGGEAVGGWTSIFKNPIMIGVAAGLLYAFSGLPLPGVAERTINILSNMALPLALLIIGAELSLWRPSQGTRDIITVSFMKMMVMPAIGLGVLYLFGFSGAEAAVTMVMLAAPCATASVILAQQMGGDPVFAAACTSFSHAVCPVTYLLWLSFFS